MGGEGDDLHRSRVIFHFTLLGHATQYTQVFVVIRVHPSSASRDLRTPAITRRPLMAVKRTNSMRITLVAVVLRVFARRFSPTSVVVNVVNVRSRGVTIGLLAWPVAHFQLGRPVFPARIITGLPSIMIAKRIRYPLLTRSRFGARISHYDRIMRRI